MKISIITPICNDVAEINACVQSVVNQTYPDVEFLVIDYGSSQLNKHKVQHELRNARYYELDCKEQVSQALNFGIRKATGDVVCILSPNDQLYDKGVLQIVANAFKSSKANIVYGNGELKHGSGILKDLRRFGSRPHRQKELAFGKIPLHTSIYIKRDMLLELGFSKENYSIESEYQLYLRLFMQQSVRPFFIDDFVLKLNLNSPSEATSPSVVKAAKEKAVSYNSISVENIALTS